MDVTIRIDEKSLPSESLEYGGLFIKRTFEKAPTRKLFLIVAYVQFDQSERQIIERAGLENLVVWKGPGFEGMLESDIK